MNAKNIKEILISYLKATNHEMRIYQEKSIGNSICDLITVTDELTGYEIKSGGDNYRRLDAQIKAYDKFFDKNYIVVGHRHIASAIEKVPSHWGIIFVKQDRNLFHSFCRAVPISALLQIWKITCLPMPRSRRLLFQNHS